MKIIAIRYQNFRNFAECGEVTFDTDGKVTIVYGANGDGKTTFHQLFQWILYGKVSFNRTTSDSKLYNLEKGEKLRKNNFFVVWGEIEFEHEGELYIVRREYKYFKNVSNKITHKAEDDYFSVKKREKNNDWKDIESPMELIEDVLPSGLSPYFFFDGETMIADLKIRGTESGNKLEKALNSIFDLDAYAKAIQDIGSASKTQSAIGYLDGMRLEAKKKSAEKEKLDEYFREIKILKRKIEECEEENEKYEERIKAINVRLEIISEEIGTSKSKKELEDERKKNKQYKEDELANINDQKLRFGKEIDKNYSYLLISQVIESAEERLYMEVQDEEQKVIPGLKKELLINLLNKSNQICICGRCIGEKESKVLEGWLSLFPPASYKATYDNFKRKAEKYCGSYDEEKLRSYIKKVLLIKDKIRIIEEDIDRIDEEIKKCGNTEALIEERKRIEVEREEIGPKIKDNIKNISDFKHSLLSRERIVENTEKANEKIEEYTVKIQLLENVVKYLQDKMKREVSEYSSKLQEEIQNLVDQMLTSKRGVILNEKFQLKVMDSFGDESKSEGQFAVICFAYIGAIFKVLKEHEKLKKKEFPLVLDGPFSKLDPEQKANVIRVIPEYAPQVIIFSKDPLDEFIPEEKVGKVWTIISNDEKNKAEIKEGFLWK